jgi:hypothetical protein
MTPLALAAVWQQEPGPRIDTHARLVTNDWYAWLLSQLLRADALQLTQLVQFGSSSSSSSSSSSKHLKSQPDPS